VPNNKKSDFFKTPRFMDVVLDSNIFRSDIPLRSKEIDVVLNYLEKTESAIIMPQIILDEITGLFSRELTKREIDAKSSVHNLNLLLPETDRITEAARIDLQMSIENYKQHVLKRLKIDSKMLLPYKNDFLPLISKRAIDRVKPSGKDGQGFRDVLIWLTIKDYCKQTRDKKLTFISNNHSDFGYDKIDGLHAELLEECKKTGIEILYFKTIKDFIEQHSTRIDFITDDWLEENIDTNVVNNQIEQALYGSMNRRIEKWFERKVGHQLTSYKVRFVDAGTNDYFSVYDMSNNEYVVNVSINARAGIEFEYLEDVYYSDDPYPMETRSQSILNVDVIGHFVVTLEGREIIEIDLQEAEI
jgi:hypothetical protein